ncbi:restriction endonuclease subunit S [Enterobacter kobei]|uniref:restriction endonuclease subunit S n=1 Tax=Enterobacter kobei TaxID=208224 RepID=UPI0028D0B026|nr:restriction endonuclease subunit S [Enterobacter kobei]WNP34163.1 restriction endonuclease subunit S [Enterobacter kobei]
MNSEKMKEVRVSDFLNITDYVANGSFASLKENVKYRDRPDYAVMIRLADYNSGWNKDFVYIDQDGFSFLKKSMVLPGDVIISNVGANAGTVFRAPNLGIPMTLGPNSVLVKPKQDKPYLNDYIYYFFVSPKGQHLLKSILSGSAQPKFNKTDFRSCKIDIPLNEDYVKYAKPLVKLDRKIRLNNQINHTIEQMAQALFKSWFVDFEPVKAKIAVLEAGGSQKDATLAAMTAISGKDADALKVFESEYPEQYAELKTTAELFPSAMQDSELGEIPEGWRHGPLSNIATFANGKVDVCSLTPETYISTENMLENRAGISTASSLPSVNSVPEFRCGHVLISNIRPYFKKIWLARFKGGRSADVLAFEALDSVTVEYVYNLLYQETFFNFMMLTSKGVKMPRGDKKAIMGWQCIHPDKKISNVFSKAVGEYYSFIEINNAQNKTLTQLRDTLLPKLLSGEITLPEAEQAISEVENV